ncbi:MAG: S-layer homology domain-containing protein, partial [Clostridiaceae bacterium]|nr:S-layer homology domain-containing protein [Clostridiaceae bacterium]
KETGEGAYLPPIFEDEPYSYAPTLIVRHGSYFDTESEEISPINIIRAPEGTFKYSNVDYEIAAGHSIEAEEFQIIPKATTGSGELYLESSGAIEVQFTKAEESGGVSGRKDTEGIIITLDKIINTLPDVSITYETNKTIETGTPQKQINGLDWYIPIPSMPEGMEAATAVTVTIGNSAYYSFDGNNTQGVTIHKRGAERKFTLLQIGGENGLKDTTGILVTFNEDTVLTKSQITLEGAAIASLTDNGDADGKTWLINIKDVAVANGYTIKVTIADVEPDGYLVEGPKDVAVYSSTGTVLTFTAKQQGGISGDKDSTGVLLTFEGPVGFLGVDKLTADKVILANAAGIGKGTLTPVNGISSEISDKWLLTLSGVIPENEFQLGIKISEWDGSSTHYRPSAETQYVKLYKDIRQKVTFTSKQLDGVNKQSRTRNIKLTFNEPVKNLTSNRINLAGATVGTLTMVGGNTEEGSKVWNLSITGIRVGNGNEITINIEDWPGYKVESKNIKTPVYTANSIGYSLTQIGGSSRTGTTKGLLLKFDEGLVPEIGLKPENYEVSLSGGKSITVAEAVYYEDINDTSTWFLELPNDSQWEDNETVTVTLKSAESGEKPGSIVVGGRDIIDYYITRSTRIYKDYQTHIKISSIKQIGGAETELASGEILGIKNTEYIEASFAYESGPGVTKGDPYTENVFRQGDIIVEGAVMDRTVWSNDKLLIYLKAVSYASGDKLKITLRDPAQAVIDNPEQEVEVYRDMRTIINFKAAVSGDYSGGDSTKINLTFTEPLPDLKYEEVKFIKGNNDDFTVKGLTPDPDNRTYTFSIELGENAVTDIKTNIEIKTDGHPKYYFMKDKTAITLHKDKREHVDVYLEQLEGKNGTKDSKGIKLTIYDIPYGREYLYHNEYEIWFKSDNKRFERPYFPYRHYTDQTLKTLVVEYHFTDWFEGQFKNKEHLGISLNSRRSDVVYNLIPVGDFEPIEEQTDNYGNKYTFVELYRNVGMSNLGTDLDRVSPGGIYKDDQEKKLTLIGRFNPQSIKQLLLRKEGDNTPGQIIPIAYKTGMGDSTGMASKLTVDVSHVDMLKEKGTYEIAFVTSLITSNYGKLIVTDNRAFSTENFGILAITQKTDKQFALEMFKSESELKTTKAKGKTLLTFKGRVQSDGFGGYKVFSDSTMNKALEYSGDTNDYIAIEEQFDGRIVVSAKNGSLRWNGIPMAKDFEIVLSSAKSYINKRGDKNGETVLLSTAYTDSFDIFLMQAGIDKYRIYEEEFSIGGHLILGNSIPFIAENLQAGADLKEMILKEGFKEMPPTHAQAWIDFSPEEWLGDFVGGNGKFNFEINSLPETNPKFVSLDGELSINDVIYISGEFVFTWGDTKDGRTLFIPDSLKFFIRSDAEGAGVPLVPPVIVAYITGVGGGIEGLQATAYKDFEYVPPFKLSIKGAIKDATGMFIDVQEATITLGPSEFSAYVEEMKVLKLITMKKVGVATGLREKKGSAPDFYFTFGGGVSFEKGPIEASASIDAGLELKGDKMESAVLDYMKQANKAGKNLVMPNKATRDKFLEVVKFWGTADAQGKFEWKCFRVDGKGHVGVDNSKLSGRLTGDIQGWTPSIGFTWYYGGDFEHDIQLWSVGKAGDDDRIILGYDENDGLIAATNLIDKGSFGPAIAPQGRMMLMSSPALVRTEVPGMEKGYVVGITAHEMYGEINIYKDGSDEIFETLRPAGEDWSETGEEYKKYGEYTTAYIIPEGGNYVFEAAGALQCTVLEILPMPEFTDLSVNAGEKEVTWSINDTAMEGIEDLSIRLTLHDAETGKLIQTLTVTDGTEWVSLPDPDEEGKWKDFEVPLTKVEAKDGRFTYSLSGSLSTGSYFIRGALLEPDSNGRGDRTLDIMDTLAFEYINSFAPVKVENVGVEYIGKGAVKISWDEVEEAGGYSVAILDELGIPVSSLAAKDVSGTETIIQGGTSIFEDEDGILTEAGLKFGKGYQVSVKAYKNKEVGFSAFAGDDDIPTNNIPVYGPAGLKGFTIDEPEIPEFTVIVNGKAKQEGDGTPTYAINVTKPTIEVSADKEVSEIKVYRINAAESNIETITGKTGSFEYDFAEEGVYKLRFDTSYGKEESSQLITVEVDTAPPYLLVDADSRTAVNGKINITGMVEKGAWVTDNGAPVAVEDGTFVIKGTTENAVTTKYLVAGDAAGNITELYIDILYKFVETDGGSGDKDKEDGKDKGLDSASNTKGSSVTLGKLQVTMPQGGEAVKNDDGSSTLTAGGSVELNEKTGLSLPKGTIIDKDSNIHIPQGEEATVTLAAGITLTIKGGTTVIPDEKAPLGYRIISDKAFGDVARGSWYEGDIAFAYAHNLFAGTGDNSFSPDMPITRGMLVTVLGRMAGADISNYGQPGFDDVEGGKYYTAFAEWARQSGIVSGIGDNKFAPEALVTRQDLAVIFYKYMRFAKMGLRESRDYKDFQDQENISDYAAEAVKAYYEGEVLNGKPGDIFDPKGNASRGELAAILHRFLGAIE